MTTLIIIWKCDETLVKISTELFEKGEDIKFLLRQHCTLVSNLEKIGKSYSMGGEYCETSVDYNGWVELIEESDRIISWC